MKNKVVITGMGALTPFGKNLTDGLSKVDKGQKHFGHSIVGRNIGDQLINTIPDEYYKGIVEDRLLGRYDRISMIVSCVINECIESGCLSVNKSLIEATGVISGSAFGCIGSNAAFVKDMIDKGPTGVDPMRFPFTSHNYPASVCSIEYGLKGPITAILSSVSSSMNALSFAYNLVANGFVERMIVIGFEELTAIACEFLRLYNKPESYGDTFSPNKVFCEGCAGVLIETNESAIKRGQKIFAEISGYAIANGGANVERPERIVNNCLKLIDKTHAHGNKADVLVLNESGDPVDDEDEKVAMAEPEKKGLLPSLHMSLKQSIGNYIGASGLMETVFALNLVSETTNGSNTIFINNFGMESNLISFAFSKQIQ